MLQEDIAKYLDSEGLVNLDLTGATGDCFIEILPPEPDEVVSIFQREGIQSDPKLPYDTTEIQIIVRGSQNPFNALNKAQKIYNAMHGFSLDRFDYEGEWIVSCIGQYGGVVRLGQDDNGRQEFEVVFDIDYENKSKYRSDF